MLWLDQQEASKRGLTVRAIEGSMDNMAMLDDASFDIAHQPVSTCYVRDLAQTYREIARVLRDGGLYISQHKQPTSLQISHRDEEDRYVIGVEYYLDGPLPSVADESYRERGTTEFLHRWDDLIGELCRSGFVLEDLREPFRADHKAAPGHFGHRGRFVPPYVRLKARRVARTCVAESTSRIWTP
jgi:SAM-dependent methyltransferase